MKIHLREAVLHDAAALYAFAKMAYTAAFGHSMSAADLEAHLANHLSFERMSEMIDSDTFLLACSAEEIIGFVQFGVSHLHKQELIKSTTFAIHDSDREIRRLYVLANCQNLGIGSLLMEEALNHPCLVGHNIFLDVWEENPGAQRFYKRYGFEKVAEKQFLVGAGVETGVDFIMRRPAWRVIAHRSIMNAIRCCTVHLGKGTEVPGHGNDYTC